MESSGNPQYVQQFASNLRALVYGKDNPTIDRAWSFLQSNYSNPLTMPTLTLLLTGTYDRDTQKSGCFYLKKMWKSQCPQLSCLDIFHQPGLQLPIARLYRDAAMQLLLRLSGQQKRSLIVSILASIRQQQNLKVTANLVVLLCAVVESVDSFNLLDIEDSLGKGIYEVIGAAVGQVKLGLDKVVQMGKLGDYQQEQMTLFQLRLELVKDALDIIVKMLEKANQHETLYYAMMAAFCMNQDFVKVLEQGICLNVPDQTQIIWQSPLKQSIAFNTFKGDLLRLCNQLFKKPLPSLFQPVLTTLMLHDSRKLDPGSSSILTQCLIMMDRFVLANNHFDYFVNNKIQICMCVFGYCIADEAEKDLMEEQPERFVQLGMDFCGCQEETELKAMAGMLLESLCDVIDGLLSVVVQTLLVMFDTSLMRKEEQHSKYASMMEYYKQMRYAQATQEEIVESTLLILASLYDQMEKRADLKNILLHLVKHREKDVLAMGLLCRNRYVLFVGHYPCITFLMTVVKMLDNAHQSTVLQTSASFGKIISQKVRTEVEDKMLMIINRMLEKLPALSSVMENMINKHFNLVNNPDSLVIVFKKLSEQIQMNYKLRPSNMISNVNRLSNLICHALSQCRQASTYQQYLLPCLILLPQYPDCQQSLLQIVTSYLDSCQHVTATQSQYLKLVFQVLESNHFVLNTCFEVFNRHLLYGTKQEHRDMILQAIVVGLERCETPADIWEFATLAEILVLQSAICDENLMVLLKGIYGKMKAVEHKVIQHKLLEVYLSLFYKFPQQVLSILGEHYQTFIISFLQTHLHLPTIQSKKIHAIYLLHLAQLDCKSPTPCTTAILNNVVTLLQELFVAQSKQQPSAYESSDAVIICIHLKQKNLKHPLDGRDAFELLSEKWEVLSKLRPEVKVDPNLNRELLSKHLSNKIVEEQIRKIVKIRR